MSHPIVKITQIALCDEVSYGQFGKANLVGLNPSNVLTITEVPYRLQSNIVIIGESHASDETDKLRSRTLLLNVTGSGLWTSEEEFSLPKAIAGDPPRIFLISYPLECLFADYGKIRISILDGDTEIAAKELRVINGPSPSVAPTSRIPHSGILESEPGITLDSIFRSANKRLVIIDKYVSPKALRDLLKQVPLTCEVCLLAGAKQKDKFVREIQTNGPFERKVDIRFADSFHDRFVIVNGSEYFHFGHSFMALWAGRLSRYSKLSGVAEIDKFQSSFEEEWVKADRT